MYYINHYVVDWDKLQSLDDIKRLLMAMDLSFEPDNPRIEDIKDLVYLQKKPRMGIQLD